jgi:hypothetical protein
MNLKLDKEDTAFSGKREDIASKLLRYDFKVSFLSQFPSTHMHKCLLSKISK